MEELGDLVGQLAILSPAQGWLPAPYTPLGSGQQERKRWSIHITLQGRAITVGALCLECCSCPSGVGKAVSLCYSEGYWDSLLICGLCSGVRLGPGRAEVLGKTSRYVGRTVNGRTMTLRILSWLCADNGRCFTYMSYDLLRSVITVSPEPGTMPGTCGINKKWLIWRCSQERKWPEFWPFLIGVQ